MKLFGQDTFQGHLPTFFYIQKNAENNNLTKIMFEGPILPPIWYHYCDCVQSEQLLHRWAQNCKNMVKLTAITEFLTNVPTTVKIWRKFLFDLALGALQQRASQKNFLFLAALKYQPLELCNKTPSGNISQKLV